MKSYGTRKNVNFTGLLSAANIRFKLNKSLYLKMESGYDMGNIIRITNAKDKKIIYPLNNTGYLMLSVNMNFGNSVFEKIF